MKKWRIEFNPKYRPTPMSFWVHAHLDGETWTESTTFDPPLPAAIPCKGFPCLVVNALGTELVFASIQEAEHFLDVISHPNMPTTRRLAARRIANHGPNSHWLSRLPAGLKTWHKRQKLIPILKEGLLAFKAVYRGKAKAQGDTTPGDISTSGETNIIP